VRARQADPTYHASRGCLLAVSSTALAIAAHGVAGGGMPDAALTLPLTALIAWGAAALAPWTRGMVTLTGLLGVLQVVLHVLLTESANSHHHHGAPQVSGWTMLVGHALATMITAALLARASSALTRISAALAWLRAGLRTLLNTPVAAPTTIGAASPVPARPGQLLEVLFRRVSSRRGPPVRS
jgi:hypothetical protein